MTDLKPEDLVKLREIAEKATPGPWSHDRADDPSASFEVFGHDGSDYENFVADCRTGRADAEFIATFDPPTVLSLLADRARMEKAIELLAEVYEAARDVSMAAVQDDDGEWSIKGDPEAMLGRLYLATEEVRKVTKGASQ